MSKPDSGRVSLANQRFYDQIAAIYDRVDSRRAGKVNHGWLDRLLAREFARLQETTGRSPAALEFLDAGAGSGFLAMHAASHFKKITLVDISQAMLDRIPLPEARKLRGDCGSLPVAAGSMDFVGAFATLHHLFSPQEFFAEAHRVLRKGGLLYTDHDIEKRFVRNFGLPLKAYRALFDHGHDYLKHCPEASEEDYKLSEFHGDDGLDGRELAVQLRKLGFDIVVEKYHWEGMGPIATALGAVGLAGLLSRRGVAPIIRLVAVKR